MTRIVHFQRVPLLVLAGCVAIEDSSNPAPQANVVWDADSDGRMEMLAGNGLWRSQPGSGAFVEVGEYSYYGFPQYLDRSRGPLVGGAGAVLLDADPGGCPGAGIRALGADGTSECVAKDDVEVQAAFFGLQQAEGPECLIRSPLGGGDAEIGCTTSTFGWQGWAALASPSQLEGRRWLPCGSVIRPPGEVGMLVCTGGQLLGWASGPVGGGELEFVEFSTVYEAGVRRAEDPRFPDHFGLGSNNSVGEPPDAPTRLCEVGDWDAGDISCEVIDAQDAISSLQFMRLEPGQSTPAVFIRSEKGERQWLYSSGDRREVTVPWPDSAEPPEGVPYGPNAGTLTVLDADGDGVDELALYEASVSAPILLEFDGDAAFVPVTPP